MEVFAHFSGSNTGFFLQDVWQDPASGEYRFLPLLNTEECRTNVEELQGNLPFYLWLFLFRHFGEAVTKRVDDELQTIRHFEL